MKNMKTIIYVMGFLTLCLFGLFIYYTYNRPAIKPPHTLKIIYGKSTTVINPDDYDVLKFSPNTKTDTIYIHDTIVEAGVVKPKKKHKVQKNDVIGLSAMWPLGLEQYNDSVIITIDTAALEKDGWIRPGTKEDSIRVKRYLDSLIHNGKIWVPANAKH